MCVFWALPCTGPPIRPIAPHPTHLPQHATITRKSIVPHVSPLHICEVPCGVGNVLYNKGAQAALFRIGGASSWSSTRRKKGGGMGRLEMGTSFLFVNAHLAAHQHKVEERNMDVDRVMTELQARCVVYMCLYGLGERRRGWERDVCEGPYLGMVLTYPSLPPYT